MRVLPGILLALAPILAGATITGVYEGTVRDETSQAKIILRCENEARCEVESQVTSAKAPQVTTSTEKYFPQKADVEGTRRSFAHARAHRALLLDPAYGTSSAELKTLLDSNADISDCLALSLAVSVCELQHSPWEKPTVVYFGADLSDCSDKRVFCAYGFMPLFQTSAVAKLAPIPDQPEQNRARPHRPTEAEIAVTPPDKWKLVDVGWLPDDELAAASDATRSAYRVFRERKYHEAYVLMLPEAERGDPVAQAAVGVLYVQGLGRARNLEKALYWLNRSDSQGCKWAAVAIARIYDDGILVQRNVDEAKKWYFRAGQTQHTSNSRLREIFWYPQNYSFNVDSPNGGGYMDPVGWVADAEKEAFSYEVYERLDGLIKLPEWFRKHATGGVIVTLAPDGTVMSLTPGPLGVGADTAVIDQEAMKQGYEAILEGARAASPLPKPPSWLPPGCKISINYPSRYLKR